MKSAGNDIVALNMINPGRTQFPGFYKKILSSSEQALYHREAAPHLPFVLFLWLLWSIKESVYKYARQNRPDLIFSPTKIITEQLSYPDATAGTPREQAIPTSTPGSFYRGSVRSGDLVFYTQSFISEDCIFTMAGDTDDFSGTCWGLHATDDAGYEQQSKAVRMFLLERLRAHFPISEWKVDKSPEGYPVLLKEGLPSGIPISFAHHGQFVGYSYCL